MTESGASIHYDLAAGSGNQNKDSTEKDSTESTKYKVEVKETSEPDKNTLDQVATDNSNDNSTEGRDETVEFNMEAAMTADDIMRAGGFGTRDDIGSFLPVAADSTDFEASLRNARDFEEPQGETLRPGLGWTQSMDED